MEALDRDARSLVESEIDELLKDPMDTERQAHLILNAQGIEPTLETVLSFTTGAIWGRVLTFYKFKHDRLLNLDELKELNELLKRRAFELRQAFIGTRIEK